jgi:hypothetical protein
MQSLWHNADGSALVEASILVPLLIVLFFGVFEFSWYFHKQQLVEIGVRDAARYLAAASSDPCANATLLTNAKNLATTGSIDASLPDRVAGWNPGDVQIPCPSGFDVPNPGNTTYNCANSPTCHVVYVTTTIPDPALGYFALLGGRVPNISASHAERAIGE